MNTKHNRIRLFSAAAASALTACTLLAAPAPTALAAMRPAGCGNSLTWVFDRDTGVLTLSGSGNMYDWSDWKEVPWYPYADAITEIVLPEHLTAIGENAFRGTAVTEVTVPESVSRIGAYAFGYCGDLKRFTVLCPECTLDASLSIFNAALADGTTEIFVQNKLCGWSGSTLQDAASGFQASFTSFRVTLTDGSGLQQTAALRSPEYTAPECTFDAPEGKVFAGWTADSGSGLFQPGETVRAGGDLTLTAVFVDEAHSGTCGESLNWVFDGEETLYITGSGDMEDWEEPALVPWYAFRKSIRSIVLPELITKIGACAFYGTEIKSVTVPESVAEIGQKAFGYCFSLTEITVLNPQCSMDETMTFYNGFNKDDVPALNVQDRIYCYYNSTLYHAVQKMNAASQRRIISVTLLADGASGEMSWDMPHSAQYTLPQYGFTAPEGKTFAGWEIGGQIKQPGDTVRVTESVTAAPVWQILAGDINADGECTVADAVMLTQYISESALSGTALTDACDVNRDSAVDLLDVQSLLDALAKQ